MVGIFASSSMLHVHDIWVANIIHMYTDDWWLQNNNLQLYMPFYMLPKIYFASL